MEGAAVALVGWFAGVQAVPNAQLRYIPRVCI